MIKLVPNIINRITVAYFGSIGTKPRNTKELVSKYMIRMAIVFRIIKVISGLFIKNDYFQGRLR